MSRGLSERDPGLPALLFGHSMGSFAAQYVLLDHLDVIHALVLSGLSATNLRHLQRAGSQAMDFLSGIDRPRTSADWLSRDPAVVDAYLADPLCRFDLTAASRASMHADADRTAEPAAHALVCRGLLIRRRAGQRPSRVGMEI